MKRCYSTLAKPLNSNHQRLFSLESCKSMSQIKQTHALLITTGLILHPITAKKLLKLLLDSSFGSLSYAHHLFDHMPNPDLFIYNTMIKAHALTPTTSHNSIRIFLSMIRLSEIFPNRYTLVFAFKACGNGLGVLEGEQIRVHAVKTGLERNIFVTNAMIRMYSNWGLVDEARRVFDWSSDLDMYSWNIMIGGYIGSAKLGRARQMFNQMSERDVVSQSTMIAGYVQV